MVEVSAPNNGNVVETAQSLDGSIETKCSASVSPGSAPSTKNGPVCGLKAVIFFEGRSSTVSTRPAKQSSVQTSSTSPGLTFITGSTPPNVHA